MGISSRGKLNDLGKKEAQEKSQTMKETRENSENIALKPFTSSG